MFGGGDEVLDAEYAEVDPTGRYMRVSFFSKLFGIILSRIRITFQVGLM